jgi:hypothetical protein
MNTAFDISRKKLNPDKRVLFFPLESFCEKGSPFSVN